MCVVHLLSGATRYLRFYSVTAEKAFDIEVIEVCAADPEELAHGHAHGPGGHGKTGTDLFSQLL